MPTTIPIPLPKDRGLSALEYLEAHGLVPRKSPIRASSYEDLRKCEFYYLLRDRFGIQSAIDVSEPLIVGSRVHKNLELALENVTGQPALDALMADAHAQNQELQDRAKMSGYRNTHDLLKKIKQYQAKADQLFTLAWAAYPIPKHYECAGCEIMCILPTRQSPCVIQVDAFLYDRKRNELWILDAKTHNGLPSIRMSTCPWEFQTLLYRHVVSELMKTGDIQTALNLPKDCKLAGMCHYVIRKPTHKILESDIALETTKGPGYAFNRWQARTIEWFKAEGEFLKNRAEWAAEPPVQSSWVRWPDQSRYEPDPDFRRQLAELQDAANRPALPELFPRSSSFIREKGSWGRDEGLSPYAVFYPDESIAYWPDIIRKGYLIGFRDWPLPTLKISKKGQPPVPLIVS